MTPIFYQQAAQLYALMYTLDPDQRIPVKHLSAQGFFDPVQEKPFVDGCAQLFEKRGYKIPFDPATLRSCFITALIEHFANKKDALPATGPCCAIAKRVAHIVSRKFNTMPLEAEEIIADVQNHLARVSQRARLQLSRNTGESPSTPSEWIQEHLLTHWLTLAKAPLNEKIPEDISVLFFISHQVFFEERFPGTQFPDEEFVTAYIDIGIRTLISKYGFERASQGLCPFDQYTTLSAITHKMHTAVEKCLERPLAELRVDISQKICDQFDLAYTEAIRDRAKILLREYPALPELPPISTFLTWAEKTLRKAFPLSGESEQLKPIENDVIEALLLEYAKYKISKMLLQLERPAPDQLVQECALYFPYISCTEQELKNKFQVYIQTQLPLVNPLNVSCPLRSEILIQKRV